MDNNYKLDQELELFNRISGQVLHQTIKTIGLKDVNRCPSICQLVSSKLCILNKFMLKNRNSNKIL
jgi:hypothetical protein